MYNKNKNRNRNQNNRDNENDDRNAGRRTSTGWSPSPSATAPLSACACAHARASELKYFDSDYPIVICWASIVRSRTVDKGEKISIREREWREVEGREGGREREYRAAAGERSWPLFAVDARN